MPEINQLIRRVRKLPMYIKNDGTITSAIYSDSLGVSVDVADNRQLIDIIKDEERLHNINNADKLIADPDGPFKLIALAAVSSKVCDEKEVCIEMDPIKEPIELLNPYHAILKKNKNEIMLTNSQRKHLAKNTKIIKSYDKDLIHETND